MRLAALGRNPENIAPHTADLFAAEAVMSRRRRRADERATVASVLAVRPPPAMVGSTSGPRSVRGWWPPHKNPRRPARKLTAGPTAADSSESMMCC
jgi:hypothetical protein